MIRVLSGVVLAAAFFALDLVRERRCAGLGRRSACASWRCTSTPRSLRRIGVGDPGLADGRRDTRRSSPQSRFRYVAPEVVLGISLVVIAAAAMFVVDRTPAADVGADPASGVSPGFVRAAHATAAGALALVYLGAAARRAGRRPHLRRPRRGAAPGVHDRRQRQRAVLCRPALRAAPARAAP